VRARGNKRGSLPFHNPLLERCQEGFRLSQCQPDVLEPLTRLLQDDNIGERFFVTLVVTHHQLDFELHGSTPPAAGWGKDGRIVAEVPGCPQICLLSYGTGIKING
jgi:hypothetical protein